MSIRKIQNITIFTELNEQGVSLPTELPAIMEDGSVRYIPIESWTPPTINTSVASDNIHVGSVQGYPSKVLCSVITDGIEENPISSFPSEIDDFGNPKVDIQTADIPDIDDFQYFKAKYPRSVIESFQLMQLRELLADKVILARDINHLRNAVIEIEKFLKKLSERVDELEKRVEKLERETIINGKNLGSGEGVFKDVANRIMNFKSLVGTGEVTVSSTQDEIEINVEVPPPTAGCGIPVKGSSFNICHGSDGDAKFPMKITDGSFDITKSGSFSFKMVDIKPVGVNNTVLPSLLISLGQGSTPSAGVANASGAGRILKCGDGFIFEVKNDDGTYSGLEIRSSVVDWFKNVRNSKVRGELNGNPPPDPYDISSSIYS